MSNPLDKYVKELKKYDEGITPADPQEEGCTRCRDEEKEHKNKK